MFTRKYGFNVKMRNVLNKVILTAKAEEGEDKVKEQPADSNPTPDITTTPSINYEDLISRARQEEKAKLYPQIDKLKKENESLVQKMNKAILESAGKDEEISSLKAQIEDVKNSKGISESEEVKKLNKKIKELEKINSDLEKSKVDVEEIRNSITQEYEVKLYKEQKMREAQANKEGFIPELIMGTTKEEIDSSLDNSKKRFAEIIKAHTSIDTEIPAVNIDTSNIGVKNVDVNSIQDMTMQEWAEKRRLLGLK